jgi:hypothetical protein
MYQFQDLFFHEQIGDTITDIPSNNSYSSNAYVGDVLVGINHIYVLHLNMNYVSQYEKNHDGTIGRRLRTNNWYSNDGTIHQICRNNSSVPSAYTLYVENGQEYLVGWSMDNSNIYTWKINSSNNSIGSRSSYNGGTSMNNYSRAGWDGDRYIYFMNTGTRILYKWDLQNKGTIPQHILSIPSNQSLSSSFTGSGLLVTDDKMYWGDGAQNSAGLLGCFSLADGSYLGEIDGNVMSNQIGVSTISGNNGNISISPLAPNVAFYFYAYTNQIKQISINSRVKVDRIEINSPIHIENAVLSARVVSVIQNEQPKFSYRVMVNDTQVFPSSGWSLEMTSPYSLTTNISHAYFDVGENYVKLEVMDDLGGKVSSQIKMIKTNEPPTINAVLSRTTIHKESVVIDATISDPERDYVRYKVFVGTKQVYPSSDFTPLFPTPNNDVQLVLSNDDFIIGLNVIKFVIEDSLGGETIKTYNVIKKNTAPVVTIGDVKGGLLIATIDDADGDRVRYKVFLNNQPEQIFPTNGFTNFLKVPFDVNVRFPQSKINVGQTNRAKIVFEDDMGIQTSREFLFMGDYSGLMFCDAFEEYYSTNIGEILRYLDFGTIVAGQTSLAERVFIKNTLGYPVENLTIKTVQRELEPPHSKVEISRYDSPFIAEPTLTFPEKIGDQEKISFYIRVVTDREAKWGGMFDITVKADPLKPLFTDKRDRNSKITVRRT